MCIWDLRGRRFGHPKNNVAINVCGGFSALLGGMRHERARALAVPAAWSQAALAGKQKLVAKQSVLRVGAGQDVWG